MSGKSLVLILMMNTDEIIIHVRKGTKKNIFTVWFALLVHNVIETKQISQQKF